MTKKMVDGVLVDLTPDEQAEHDQRLAFVEPPSTADVAGLSVLIQIGAVNSLVTDGSVVLDAFGLQDKKSSIVADMAVLMDNKIDAGGILPADDQITLTKAKMGWGFLKSVEAAAKLISEDVINGVITTIEDIGTDSRWPSLGS